MAIITDAKNARYGDNGIITADVRFDDLSTQDGTPLYLPYISTAHDTADFGPQLYSDLKSGKYGPVTPFTVTSEMIQTAKDQKHNEINVWRDVQESGSTTFSLNGHNWDCNKPSQERLGAALAAARANILPADFFWTDADNIDVPVKAADLESMSAVMAATMFLQGFKIHERQRQMKEEVDALTDYQVIKDYIVGWTDLG
ncbi:DUF4376 domain-containing protein [Salmonella enterica]|uniref:DUF4376 domain-containing protein n=1 Tax=Salmonella enterica TaxID=28901 RepID=UPI0003BD5259|nr:DUF4376 domain-containing protein [Salmonella enterica]EFU5484439.1 DUF4376 domain-containing protein [Salmonella enterica subsp. enterica serovar Muenchen]EHE7040274.1 DUF4376 domain-containing protein [Salmonella enterica subsp. enterica serovar Newport]EHJ5404116.1 DUF4376 domain-containing protein [Salmonella enterica subsp. enterica serovar Wedding]EIK6737049.1 DUF4376 domain-containing protein [Salmonella enterica subsp. enterica serovar Aqua]ESG65603.1 hypothetical protein SEEM1594_1